MSNKVVNRPWGTFEILNQFEIENDQYGNIEGKDVVIKRIIVKPEQMLSYQSHKNRRENWVIVQGIGLVIIEGQEKVVKRGDIIQINKEKKHTIKNKHSNLDLIFIEICEGVFKEKDIVRYSDIYGRVKDNI